MINFSGEQKYVLAATLGELLLANQATVCSVESCTGGGLAHAITHVAGSSAWFNQSWVTYSNQAKHELVGVQQTTLQEFGAVSSQTVIEMAIGALLRAKASYALSISGIAGPGGGNTEKPVGLVWFGLATASGCNSFKQVFPGDREAVREQAVVYALEKLIQSLNDEY